MCVQIIDSTMMQLQTVIGKLQSAGTAVPETQELVARAQNLIHDVTAARQVVTVFPPPHSLPWSARTIG